MAAREVKNAAIRVENLVKTFKDVRAVNGVSFAVEEGELFAFLGENGAGKSTSIAVICGLLQKDGGKVYVAGQDAEKNDSAKSKIGVVFQNSVLDKALSARDNLCSRAALYGIVGEKFRQRLTELDGLLHFKEFVDRPLSRLSGGQRRKIDIARALVHKPKILILDDSTSAVDTKTDALIRKALKDYIPQTTKIIIAQRIASVSDADKIIIMENGRITATGTHDSLLKSNDVYAELYRSQNKEDK